MTASISTVVSFNVKYETAAYKGHNLFLSDHGRISPSLYRINTDISTL